MLSTYITIEHSGTEGQIAQLFTNVRGNKRKFQGQQGALYFEPAFTEMLKRYAMIRREKDEARLNAFVRTRYNVVIRSIIVGIIILISLCCVAQAYLSTLVRYNPG